MIRTFLDLQVRPGHADKLVAVFERQSILDVSVAQSGCSSADLSVSDDGLVVTITATWDSPAAYAVWTARGDRASLADLINPHLSEPIGETTSGRIHRVAVVGRPRHVGTESTAAGRDENEGGDE